MDNDRAIVAAALPSRARLDRVLTWLCQGLMRIFFRHVKVQGLERVPRGVPLVLVANHHNSLIDPLLLLAHLDARPRTLAKSTLWDIPLLRTLLNLGGVIPVYRRQDEGTDISRNRETFGKCHEELARGGAVALFPEGISHDAPHLAQLKTGAARIALEAEERFGPLGTFIVPVGLTFEEKGTFRSRALVQVGEPIEVAPWQARRVAASPDQARQVVRELTDAVRTGLAKVTLNYTSHEDARAIERGSELLARGELELPARMALDEAFSLRQVFIDGARKARERFPERVRSIRQRLARYDEELARLGLRDDQVAARYDSADVSLYLLGSASLLLFWLPLAAVGTLIHFIPYRLCGVIAPFTKTQDLPATMKLFSGFFLFPITWLVVCALTWGAAGWGWALLMAFLVPTSGWFAMLFHERHEHFWDELESYLTLKLHPTRAARLREEREQLRNEIKEVARLERDESAAASRDRGIGGS